MGISLQQFEQLKARVRKTRNGTLAPDESVAAASAFTKGIVLGIDPSLRGTGFGVIRTSRTGAEMLACGTITCPAGWQRSRCLAKISHSIRELIHSHGPTVCVVEGLFFAQNLQTALIMGEARGAALAVVAEAGLEIFEIAPRKVKQAIVGYGAAQKLAVAKMVQRMLGLVEVPAPDAADALALAITFAQTKSRIGTGAPKRV